MLILLIHSSIPIDFMGLVYLPTFGWRFIVNVGKYTIHGCLIGCSDSYLWEYIGDSLDVEVVVAPVAPGLKRVKFHRPHWIYTRWFKDIQNAHVCCGWRSYYYALKRSLNHPKQVRKKNARYICSFFQWVHWYWWQRLLFDEFDQTSKYCKMMISK